MSPTDATDTSTGAFQNAHDFVIQRATMIDYSGAQIDTQINNWTSGQPLSPLKVKVPLMTQMFTGQEMYLERLHNYFGTGGISSQRKSFLLFGMGGIGKTQICLKFKDEMSERVDHIFWIDTTSEETASESFNDIFKMNGGSGHFGAAFSVETVLNWISSLKSKWLMIFDNADSSPAEVEKFLPSGNVGNILITSRNPGLRFITGYKNSIEVTEMSKETASILLLRTVGLDDNPSGYLQVAKQIVTTLECVPLAVVQAGAYITAGKCGIHDFLHIYAKHGQALMNNSTFRGATKYEKSVYRTWEISFDKILEMSKNVDDKANALAASNAINIINICAFFHQEKISQKIFERAARHYHANMERYSYDGMPVFLRSIDVNLLNFGDNNEWNEIRFRESIGILASFSLIKTIGDRNEYGFHPLIQAWCRNRLSYEEKKTWIMNARGILVSSITPQLQSTEEYSYQCSILLHVMQNLNHGENIENIAYHNDVFCNLAIILRTNGRYDLERKLRSIILVTNKKILGEEHPCTIGCMATLGSAYRNLRKWKAAEDLEHKVLEMRTKSLGPDHHYTLISMANLAATYRNQGKWLNAEKLQIKVMDIATRKLGPLHYDTVNSMANLAITYRALNKWTEAETLQRRVVEMSNKIYGAEHPDTLTSMANLAVIFRHQKEWSQAEEIQKQVMAMRSKILGPDHPGNIYIVSDLALTYRNQEKWALSEIYQKQAMDLSIRIHGSDHIDTLRTMANLAYDYKRQKKWSDALNLQTKVVKLSAKIFGIEHDETIEANVQLGAIFKYLGKLQEAEMTELDVIEISKKVHGAGHAKTLKIIYNLSYTYSLQKKWAQTEKLQIEVLNRKAEIYGPEHYETLVMMKALSSTYRSQGKWAQAESILRKLTEICKGVRGPDDRETLISMANLASVYRSQLKWSEAEKVQIQVVKVSTKIFGLNHIETLNTLANLGWDYRSQKNWSEAVKVYEAHLDLCIKLKGEEHRDTTQSMAYLGSTYRYLGKLQKAEELEINALEINTRILGHEHRYTLTNMANLSITYQMQQKSAQAERLQLEVLDKRTRTLGPEHPETLMIKSIMSTTYREQMKWREAEKLLGEVAELVIKIRGSKHPETYKTFDNLHYLAQAMWKYGERESAERVMLKAVEYKSKAFGEESTTTKWSVKALQKIQNGGVAP